MSSSPHHLDGGNCNITSSQLKALFKAREQIDTFRGLVNHSALRSDDLERKLNVFIEKVAYYERDSASKSEIIRRLETRVAYLERLLIDAMQPKPTPAYVYAPIPVQSLTTEGQTMFYTEKDLPVVPLYPQQSG